MRKKILITGASGNLGLETIKLLDKNNSEELEIIAGVRDINNESC